MNDLAVGALSALVAGLTSAVQPCPLMTNLAALSYICGWAPNPRRALWAGLGVVAGFVSAVVAVGAAITLAGVAIPAVAIPLQEYVRVLLGPVMVVAGMLQAGLLHWPGSAGGSRIRLVPEQITAGSTSVGLGVLLALALCPASAGFFFGIAVPLAIRHAAPVLLPALYALGAAAPLLAGIVVVARGGRLLHLRSAGGMARARVIGRGAGWLLILMGVAWTVREVFLG